MKKMMDSARLFCVLLFVFEGGCLDLSNETLKKYTVTQSELEGVRQIANGDWQNGIKYRIERDYNGVTEPGLRIPQAGALHAIASYWTTNTEPALVVMPAGTGKTEVMIAEKIHDQVH